MNKLAELKENFCWKSKTKSVWQENPDLLDRVIARIHSEATVYDAIIRSKNRNIPTNEKIFKTVKFLEENSFWRSNPFSLISCTENDPDIIKTTSRLQKKCIRDLWDPGDELARKKPNMAIQSSTENIPPQSTCTTASIDSTNINIAPINSIPQIISTNDSSCPINNSLSKSDYDFCSKSENSVNSPTVNLIKNESSSSASSSSIEVQTSPRKFAVVSAKSIGIKSIRRNNLLNDYNYDTSSNFSRTYAEAVRGSSQTPLETQNKVLKTTSVWD